MAISVGDILEVQHNFAQAGVTAKMIQFIEVTALDAGGAPLTEEELAVDIFAHVSPTWLSIISSVSQFVNVYIRNRTNPLFEGYSTQPAATGTGGTVSPPFVAIGIFQARATTATRNGYKRFPFPSEARTTGNVVNLTVAQDTFLREFFGEGGIIPDSAAIDSPTTYKNAIIPRVLQGAPPEYVPDYNNPNYILSAVPNRVTTQNTRKT